MRACPDREKASRETLRLLVRLITFRETTPTRRKIKSKSACLLDPCKRRPERSQSPAYCDCVLRTNIIDAPIPSPRSLAARLMVLSPLAYRGGPGLPGRSIRESFCGNESEISGCQRRLRPGDARILLTGYFLPYAPNIPIACSRPLFQVRRTARLFPQNQDQDQSPSTRCPHLCESPP